MDVYVGGTRIGPHPIDVERMVGLPILEGRRVGAHLSYGPAKLKYDGVGGRGGCLPGMRREGVDSVVTQGWQIF
jgi:hypothetical protein